MIKKKHFPVEYLNTLTPGGCLRIFYSLKLGRMLVRNKNMKQGLCNGTRILIKQIYENFLDVEIVSGNSNF